MLSLPRIRERLRAKQESEPLPLARLDQLLDVPVDRFVKNMARLIKDFRKRGVRIAVEAPPSLEPIDPRVSWQGFYEAEVQRLPRLDRAAEFAMSRRHEFLRARARAALRELGLSDVQTDRDHNLAELAAPALRQLARRNPRAAAYLQACLDEHLALRNLFVQSSLHLVFGCAHRYRGLGVDLIDLIQEGNASLFQAVDGYDWRRDVRFKTYAQYWIQQAILKVLYNASRTVRVPVWVQKALKKIQRVREAERIRQGQEPSAEEIGRQLDLPAERVRELLATRRYAVSLDAELPGEEGGTLGSLLQDDKSPEIADAVLDESLAGRLGEVLADLPERERMILTRRFGIDGKEPETLGEIAIRLGITAERVRQLQKAALARLQRPAKLDRLRSFA